MNLIQERIINASIMLKGKPLLWNSFKVSLNSKVFSNIEGSHLLSFIMFDCDGAILHFVEDNVDWALLCCRPGRCRHCRSRRSRSSAGSHSASSPWDKLCTGYRSLYTAPELFLTPADESLELEWRGSSEKTTFHWELHSSL